MTSGAAPNLICFGTPVTISGDVKDAKSGVVVTMQRRATTGGTFASLGTATTANDGRYSFVEPSRIEARSSMRLRSRRY